MACRRASSTPSEKPVSVQPLAAPTAPVFGSVPPLPKPTLSGTNPFSSFTGLSNSSQPSAAPSANPFSGFSGLVATSSTASTNPLGGLSKATEVAKTQITAEKTEQKLGASVVMASNNSNSEGPESEYKKKVKKLNQAFLSWAERQIKENAVAVWKDGVKVLHAE